MSPFSKKNPSEFITELDRKFVTRIFSFYYLSLLWGNSKIPQTHQKTLAKMTESSTCCVLLLERNRKPGKNS